MLSKVFRQFVILSVCLLLPMVSSAGLLTLDQISQNQPEHKLSHKIAKEMENPIVKAEIEKLGISVEEAQSRTMALTDSEIMQHLGTEHQAGGDVIAISLTTVLLVVIIFLLID